METLKLLKQLTKKFGSVSKTQSYQTVAVQKSVGMLLSHGADP